MQSYAAVKALIPMSITGGRRNFGSRKKRLAGDTAREATSDEIKNLRGETRLLKETVVKLLMENRLLKKV